MAMNGQQVRVKAISCVDRLAAEVEMSAASGLPCHMARFRMLHWTHFCACPGLVPLCSLPLGVLPQGGSYSESSVYWRFDSIELMYDVCKRGFAIRTCLL